MSDTPSSVERGAKPAAPLPKRRRWPTIVLALVLLVSGIAIGSGLTVLVVLRRVHDRLHHPEQLPADATAYLRWWLELNDEQAESVEATLRERRARILELRRRFQPELEEQIDRIEEEVGAVLKPEQKEKWTQWYRAKRRLWVPPLPDPAEEEKAPTP